MVARTMWVRWRGAAAPSVEASLSPLLCPSILLPSQGFLCFEGRRKPGSRALHGSAEGYSARTRLWLHSRKARRCRILFRSLSTCIYVCVIKDICPAAGLFIQRVIRWLVAGTRAHRQSVLRWPWRWPPCQPDIHHCSMPRARTRAQIAADQKAFG